MVWELLANTKLKGTKSVQGAALGTTLGANARTKIAKANSEILSSIVCHTTTFTHHVQLGIT